MDGKQHFINRILSLPETKFPVTAYDGDVMKYIGDHKLYVYFQKNWIDLEEAMKLTWQIN